MAHRDLLRLGASPTADELAAQRAKHKKEHMIRVGTLRDLEERVEVCVCAGKHKYVCEGVKTYMHARRLTTITCESATHSQSWKY
jgi:hypothetical protein